MNRFVYGGFVLMAGAALALAADAAAGKKLYDVKCKSCHGVDGTPNAAIAKSLKVEMKHLADAKDEAKAKKETVGGVGKMKGIKLTDAEWADMWAHMKTFKK